MIQEVVGARVGPYHLPAFAGVGLSENDFRWSPRIDRHDGLLRIVPGLGTRAVDRVGDDYPVLVAPGKPGLRVNTTPWEIERYAPRRPVTARGLAEMIVALIEGGFIVSLSRVDATFIARQSRQFRDYLGLLFDERRPARAAGKRKRPRQAA